MSATPAPRRSAHALIGLALALLGVASAALAWRMPAGTTALPGPGLLPLVLGVLLAGVGAALAVQRPTGGDPIVVPGRQAFVAVASLVLAAALLERAGALITITLMMTLLLRVLVKLGWLGALAAGVATAAACWLVFGLVLKTPLPAGLLELR